MFYVVHHSKFARVTRECDSRDVALAVATATMTSILMNAGTFNVHEEHHRGDPPITNIFITEL